MSPTSHPAHDDDSKEYILEVDLGMFFCVCICVCVCLVLSIFAVISNIQNTLFKLFFISYMCCVEDRQCKK